METPDAQAARLVELLATTLRAMRTLVESRHRVDLSDMKWQIGRLCAASLDLPPEQGRVLRQGLTDLLAELEALHAAVVDAGP